MKYFKLYENWNGESINESNQSDLIQSLIADQPTEFANVVEKIFASSGGQLAFVYTNEKTGEVESIEIEPTELPKGSKNTFTEVNSTYKDIETYEKDFGKLILTFAGKTRKIRTPYGERICELGTYGGVKKNGDLNTLYLGRIYTLALCSKLPSIELTPKVAPGIGYETMQIDNLDKGLAEIFTKVGNAKSKGLPLFINDQDMGVSINGGVKVDGVPKSDLSFGIDEKPNFWVSYKHGEYINDEGVADKVSFQQYGSVSSFFNKKFDKAVGSKDIRKIMDKFFDRVKIEADKDGPPNRNFEGVTNVEFPKLPINEKTGKGKKHQCIVVTHKYGEDTIKPGDSGIDEDMIKQLAGNESSLKTILKKKKSINLTILATSGWSARESITDMGKLGTEITLLSIFGVDYGGKPGEDNVNVLMQDAAPFTIGLKLEDDEVVGVSVETSSNGHVMFNPKMYGDSKNPPEFLEKYEPYLVARYTGGQHWYWDDKGIIGVRGLIMPKYHSKEDTDI